jgi:pyrroline-5-carboxylate reductase
MRICIVGVGALGSAVAECLFATGTSPAEILLVERTTEKASERRERFACRVAVSTEELSRHEPPDIVFLTVKPQDFVQACDTIRPLITQRNLLISCMAGVHTSILARLINHSGIIRAMPNLGTAMRQSATVYYAPPQLSGELRQQGEDVLRLLGKTWRVDHEELMDTATAIAGSGPAYICWLAEIMQQEADRLGIAATDSRELVLQTLRATVEYLEHSQLPFEELRRKVTSRGGTTAAALSVLAHYNAHDTFRKAIDAAFQRSVELGTADKPATLTKTTN